MKIFHDFSVSGGTAKVSCCLTEMCSLGCSHNLLLPLDMGDWPSFPLVLAYMQFPSDLALLEFVNLG